MKKIIRFIIVMLLIALLAISSFFLLKNKKEDDLQEDIFEEIIDIAEDKGNSIVTEKEEQEINMQELYKVNNDIVGWIKIEETNINYPVMQTKERPQFYLRKNFYKEYSLWGTPFLAGNCDIQASDNLIIYGHHINNSKMFGELEKYKKQEFYENHKLIQFYTLKGKSEYEIIAVFKAIANCGFQYQNFTKAKEQNEFNNFVRKCKEKSFYSIKENAEYGDKLITLSTCDYSLTNGRLVVVARKINE